MTVRHTIGAAALIIGGLLLLGGLVSSPQVTTTSCTQAGTASQGATGAPTQTPDCTTETRPATGQQLYLLGIGLTGVVLGAGISLGDVLLVRIR